MTNEKQHGVLRRFAGRRSSYSTQARNGLAPLELVLWLPLLLFTTALIVNFGTMAAWRVRGEVVARDAVWRARSPRTGSNEAAEKNWPENARMELKADLPVTVLDAPQVNHPVVRGPLSSDFVVLPTLDPSLGAWRGESEVTRAYPLLPRLGEFESGNIQHPLLDHKWSVADMGIRTNRTRRIESIYVLPRTANHLPQAFVDAVDSLFAMVNYDALGTLVKHRDFHPRVNSRIYGKSVEHVREKAVERRVTDFQDLLGDFQLGGVSLLPRKMAEFYYDMYRAQVDQLLAQLLNMQRELTDLPNEIARLQQLQSQLPGLISRLRAQLNTNPPPPPDEVQRLTDLIRTAEDQLKALPDQISELRQRLNDLPDLISQTEAKIDELDIKIQQLLAFLARIPAIENELRARHVLNSGLL